MESPILDVIVSFVEVFKSLSETQRDNLVIFLFYLLALFSVYQASRIALKGFYKKNPKKLNGAAWFVTVIIVSMSFIAFFAMGAVKVKAFISFFGGWWTLIILGAMSVTSYITYRDIVKRRIPDSGVFMQEILPVSLIMIFMIQVIGFLAENLFEGQQKNVIWILNNWISNGWDTTLIVILTGTIVWGIFSGLKGKMSKDSAKTPEEEANIETNQEAKQALSDIERVLGSLMNKVKGARNYIDNLKDEEVASGDEATAGGTV